MIRSSGYIVFLAALFLGVSYTLRSVGFWGRIGLSDPKGFEAIGLLFFAMLFILQNILFQPYLLVLEERHRQTDGKRKDAEASRLRADELMTRYERAIDDARLNAVRERETMALAAEEDEKRKLQEVRQREKERSGKLREELERDSEKARRELSAAVETMAEEVAQTVLRPASARRAPQGFRAAVVNEG